MLAAQMEKGFAFVGATIDKVETKVEKIDARMERGFAAVAGDIADIGRDMATKEQIISLHTQANSIETQFRDMKYDHLATRVADLEEKAFGTTHA